MTIPRFLASSILALAVLLSASPAHAAKSWKLRFDPKPGSVQFFAVTTHLAMTADLGLLGSKNGQLDMRVELRQHVVDRRRRGPTTLELICERIQLELQSDQRTLSYDSAEPKTGDADPASDYLDRLIGQAVTVVVSRQGEITEVRGLEGRRDDAGGSGAFMEMLTPEVGVEMLKALYQQASPVFPETRLRAGDTWTAESTIPDPAFGTLRIDSDYELLEAGKLKRRHKYVKTAVRYRIELDGRGPLLDRIGEQIGAKGEIRVTTERAQGSGTIWTERGNGVTLGVISEQQMTLRLSVPLNVVGFTRRVTVPVTLEQRTSFERME